MMSTRRDANIWCTNKMHKLIEQNLVVHANYSIEVQTMQAKITKQKLCKPTNWMQTRGKKKNVKKGHKCGSKWWMCVQRARTM